MTNPVHRSTVKGNDVCGYDGRIHIPIPGWGVSPMCWGVKVSLDETDGFGCHIPAPPRKAVTPPVCCRLHLCSTLEVRVQEHATALCPTRQLGRESRNGSP
jgi:hypothetical protein